MAEETPPIVELAEWFQTPPGQYALAWERAQFDAAVADVFGYYAWQVGLADLNLLRANRMPFKGYVGTETPTPENIAGWQSRVVLAQPEALPFESQSVDLLILPHAFECTSEPHNVLREVERVLVPEGRVVISGFNPWSMWGARTRMPGMEPWLPQPPSSQVSLPRLKDWFKLLSLEVEQSHFGCYAPACRSEKWLQRWGFLESAGARWWSLGGGAVYLVSAVKRVAGMRIIGPAWKAKPKRARAASVVVNRQAGDGFDRS
ncbi:class I SAM-dependent methyltransferase [Achromobacter ruhlandii]|uniref:class I SAM-dependent methyltransferase n=1 Tax=Achromobacter ruhlandii TaxID=72557 RepID=UPI0022B8C218|nr:methyltransferase domain-containing protein [Achromobacter ruhlandii]MCZ8395956.1 methyltransferase domain-containing protein [Achromobacter ruhlandii]